MFNCSASVCSSATDFCFNSAISTDETPGKRALPDNRRAMGKLRTRNSVGLVVEYGVGPGYRSVLNGLYRGVSCRTGPKEQLNLGRLGGSVKGGGGGKDG